VRKYLVLLPPWPFAANNFTLARARRGVSGPDFTSREQSSEAQLLKGQSKQILKVLAVISLGLRHALTILTFLMRIPL
jgi:hypothetical protein